MTSGDQIKK